MRNTTTGWGLRMAAAATVAIAAFGFGATSAGAAPVTTGVSAAAYEWSAAHETASASGTSSSTTSDLLKTIQVVGTLSNTDGNCYRLHMLTKRSITGPPVTAADLCGPGSIDFTTGGSGIATPTLSFAVRICRVVSGTVTTCGASVPVK